MTRTITLGHVDYNNVGRKDNLVDVDLTLTDDNKFTISGGIWNRTKTDIYVGGQCQNEINEYFAGTQPWDTLFGLWNRCHLNNLHAGTPKQEALVKELDHYDYRAACELLRNHDEYVVSAKEADPYRKADSSHRGQPYIYGSEWLTWPISPNDLMTIKSLIQGEDGTK